MNRFLKAPAAKALYCLISIGSLNACHLHLSPDSPTSITLERVFAPTIFYDCNGDFVSQETLEVSPPQRWVAIESDEPGEVVSGSVSNREIPHSNSPMIFFPDYDEISFIVSISDTVLGLQVKPGLNTLDYELVHESFVEEEHETGVLELDISYIETYESDLRYRHPTAEECAP